MDGAQCKDCQFYLQHYTFNSRKIFHVHCGHCILSRPKHKLPDRKACENFIAAPPREDAFVSKEYLSKELLQYVLSLELLPEIEDRGWGIRYACCILMGSNPLPQQNGSLFTSVPDAPVIHGFSHGLTNSPPDCLLHQCAHWCRPFESILILCQQKNRCVSSGFCWQRMRDSIAFPP